MVAMDMDDGEVAVSLAGEIGSSVSALKVGPQLFTRYGPEIVSRIMDQGAEVFLDLKFHDIPNTVAKAVEGIAGLGVSWFTVHASGGEEMVAAAKEAAGDAKVLAVTVLTSLKVVDAQKIGFARPLDEQVTALAKLARGAGADGIVCSPLEITAVRQAVDSDCVIVTPGIRPSGASKDDQARTATPSQAIANGADYLVVGRPIVKAVDRAAAVREILGEMNSKVS
jgi:orotidine-5'-phosphate decarboxylase